MQIIREVTEQDLPAADREELRTALSRWADEGVAEPMIPFNEDIDGDGTTDVFMLDGFGRLVFASGVRIHDTVSVSDGTGIEASHA